MVEKSGDDYEMYSPKTRWSIYRPKTKVYGENIFTKYIFPRVPERMRPYLLNFVFIFLAVLILNFLYHDTLSLSYLFVGAINNWYLVFLPMLKEGVGTAFDLIYVVVTGIFYAYFYYCLVMLVYGTFSEYDDKDVWIMWVWIIVLAWILISFFPLLK